MMITHRASISMLPLCDSFKSFIFNHPRIILISEILSVSKNVVNYLSSPVRFISQNLEKLGGLIIRKAS